VKKNKPTVTIQAGDDRLAANELEVKVLLRGTPVAVIYALAHGLPRDALEAIQSALTEEMARRPPSRPSHRRTKTRP